MFDWQWMPSLLYSRIISLASIFKLFFLANGAREVCVQKTGNAYVKTTATPNPPSHCNLCVQARKIRKEKVILMAIKANSLSHT